MSFEIKYDRDGSVIVPKEQPAFVEEAKKMHEEAQQPQVTQSVEQIQEAVEEAVDVEQLITPESEQPSQQEEPSTISPRVDKRLKVLMDKAQRIEKERNDAMQRIQELESERYRYTTHKVPMAVSEPEDEDIVLGADDIAEGKHISKMQNKINRLEAALHNQQQQNAAEIARARLKSQFPDFEKVFNQENLTVLQELEPEIARSLNSNGDLYSAGASAYKIIKQLRIHVEDTFQADKDKAHKNAAKPKSLATISPQKGESPLTQVNAFAQGLTPELKKKLFLEMQEAQRNR